MAYESNNTGKDIDGLRYTGFLALTAVETTTMTLADTYYMVDGIFTDGSLSKEFTITPDGSLTYIGEDGVLELNGTSDVALSGASAARMTYGLFVNGVLVPGAETPHDFQSFSSAENISITGLLEIVSGDVITVRAMCDDAARIITVDTLNVVLRKT